MNNTQKHGRTKMMDTGLQVQSDNQFICLEIQLNTGQDQWQCQAWAGGLRPKMSLSPHPL